MVPDPNDRQIMPNSVASNFLIRYYVNLFKISIWHTVQLNSTVIRNSLGNFKCSKIIFVNLIQHIMRCRQTNDSFTVQRCFRKYFREICEISTHSIRLPAFIFRCSDCNVGQVANKVFVTFKNIKNQMSNMTDCKQGKILPNS